jgi:hypothetical protein
MSTGSNTTGSNTIMHMLSIVAARRGTIDPLKRACVYEYRVTSRVVDEQEVM